MPKEDTKLLIKQEDGAKAGLTEDTTGSLNSQSLLLGGLFAFLAGFAYTVQNAVVASEKINFSDAIIVRYSVTAFLTLIAMKIMNKCSQNQEASPTSLTKSLWIYEADPGQNINLLRGLLVLRGIFSGICILSDFHCVSNMPLGDASAIIFSAPLPSMILSAIFLGTRLRLYKAICGALLYCGVLLVIQPPFIFQHLVSVVQSPEENIGETGNYYFGPLMGIVAAMSRAAIYVSTRRLCQNQSSSSVYLLTFHACLAGLLLNVVWCFIVGENQIFSSQIIIISSRTWLVYLIIALIAGASGLLINLAVKLANPVLVSFVRSSDIIVAYGIQVLFFHQPLSMLGVAGSSCIIMAIAILQFENKFNTFLPIILKPVF